MPAASYAIESGSVVYTHHYTGRQVLDGADPATFEPLIDPVVVGSFSEWHFAGKDHRAVWFMSLRLDADVASFRYFFGGQCHWGTDRSHMYCFYPDRKPRAKVARSSAAESFRFLDEPYGAYMRRYALDDRRVYYHGRQVRGADPGSFRNLPVDLLSGTGWSDIYRDDRFAYFYGRRLEGIDPGELIIFRYPGLGRPVYVLDREAVYVADTVRTPNRAVSNTPLTRLTHDEVLTAPRYGDVRDYLSRHSELRDYWFNRGGVV